MDRRPTEPPIGIALANAARDVSRAFDEALGAAGGSRSEWLVLMALKRTPTANQRELAARVGIQGATLTHHLNAMERAGLVTRRRDPDNRRVHIVEVAEEGEAAFDRMVRVARAFDERLRAGSSEEDVAQLRRLLSRLRQNVMRDASPGTAPVGAPSAVSAGGTTGPDATGPTERRPPHDE